MAARIALRIAAHRPARKASEITCPILLCVCDNDTLASPKAAIKAAENAPRGEVTRYPIGHFEIYVGEWFERAVADQTAFFLRHLLNGDARRGSRPVARDHGIVS